MAFPSPLEPHTGQLAVAGVSKGSREPRGGPRGKKSREPETAAVGTGRAGMGTACYGAAARVGLKGKSEVGCRNETRLAARAGITRKKRKRWLKCRENRRTAKT